MARETNNPNVTALILAWYALARVGDCIDGFYHEQMADLAEKNRQEWYPILEQGDVLSHQIRQYVRHTEMRCNTCRELADDVCYGCEVAMCLSCFPDGGAAPNFCPSCENGPDSAYDMQWGGSPMDPGVTKALIQLTVLHKKLDVICAEIQEARELLAVAEEAAS